MKNEDPCRDPRYRRRRILAEIEDSASDIVCLQEVTNYSEKENYFYRKLESFGYLVIRSGPDKQTLEQDKPKHLRYFDLVIAVKHNWRLIDRQDIDFYKVKYQYSRC